MILAGPVVGWVGAITLFAVLCARHQAFAGKSVVLFGAHILSLAVVSAWVARHTGALLEQAGASPVVSLALATFGGLATGAAVFMAASLVRKVPEAVVCTRYVRWQGDALVRRVYGAGRG